MKKLLALVVAFLLTACGEAGEPSTSSVEGLSLDQRASLEVQAERTVVALDMMIKLGCFHAKRIGKPEVCDDIVTSWDGYWRGQFYVHFAGVSKDLGDHRPYSIYLELVTGLLKEALGDWLFTALHLDDLDIFNYGLPVTFSPYAYAPWCKETTDKPCGEEYGLHATPVFGVTSYWAAWGACTGATWGMGAIAFLCAPVGMVAERLTLETWAPKLSVKIWTRNNH